MKKMFCLLLAAALTVSLFSACGAADRESTESKEAESSEAEGSEAESSEPESTEPEGFSMEAYLRKTADAYPDAAPAELIAEIAKSPYFALFTTYIPKDYYPALDYEYQPEGIRDAAALFDSISGKGSILYVLEPEDDAAAKALLKDFKEKADPKWMDFDGGGLDGSFAEILHGKVIFAMYDTALQPVEGPIMEKGRDFVPMFHDYRKDHPEAGCLEMAEYFAGHQKYAAMYTTAVQEGQIQGFGSFEKEVEIKGFIDAAGFIPQMSPTLFIGYVFRLAPEADKEAFAAMLEENANLAWNVCMAANTVIVETDGDFVLFMMCDENK